jgi:hypothetical protein
VQCDTRPDLDIATEMLLTNYQPVQKTQATLFDEVAV